MKSKLLLCGAALMVLAGCASQPNPFASQAEFPYAYDMLPNPLPELTGTELDKINALPPATPTPGIVTSSHDGRSLEYK